MVDDDLLIIYTCWNVSVFPSVSSDEFSIRLYPQKFLLYVFLILSAFLSRNLMITWSHDEPYSAQIFSFGFIISSIVIFDIGNPQKLSSIIILSRIVHGIREVKIAATPDFGPKFRAG